MLELIQCQIFHFESTLLTHKTARMFKHFHNITPNSLIDVFLNIYRHYILYIISIVITAHTIYFPACYVHLNKINDKNH